MTFDSVGAFMSSASAWLATNDEVPDVIIESIIPPPLFTDLPNNDSFFDALEDPAAFLGRVNHTTVSQVHFGSSVSILNPVKLIGHAGPIRNVTGKVISIGSLYYTIAVTNQVTGDIEHHRRCIDNLVLVELPSSVPVTSVISATVTSVTTEVTAVRQAIRGLEENLTGLEEELSDFNLNSSSAYILSYSEYFECLDYLLPVDPLCHFFDSIDDGLGQMFFTGLPHDSLNIDDDEDDAAVSYFGCFNADDGIPDDDIF